MKSKTQLLAAGYQACSVAEQKVSSGQLGIVTHTVFVNVPWMQASTEALLWAKQIIERLQGFPLPIDAGFRKGPYPVFPLRFQTWYAYLLRRDHPDSLV